jgi:hypothetical protein
VSHPHGPEHRPDQPPRPGFAPYRFPQPAPRPAPSGVTGIIATVLAGLGAAMCLGGSLLGILGLAGVSGFGSGSRIQTSVGISGAVLPVLILGIVLNLVSGALLTAGTVTLAQRRTSGRRFVVSGCAVTLAGNLLSLGYATSAMGPNGGGATFALLGLIFPIATLVLVLVPSTNAWITAKRRPSSPY